MLAVRVLTAVVLLVATALMAPVDLLSEITVFAVLDVVRRLLDDDSCPPSRPSRLT